MTTQKLDIAIDDLLLDKENPRLGEVTDQSAALTAVVDLNPRHFVTMMKSIAQHGLDPGDSFYIIQDNDEDGHTVVDGNRRLAALKVLTTPSLLQGTEIPDSVKKQLLKAGEGFKISSLQLVPCVLFNDRDEANEWILRRHGRGLEGEERIHWGPLEIQRFQKDRSISDVIDFVERNSIISNELWPTVRQGVEDVSYVLKRLLESKRGREWFGLTIQSLDGFKIPFAKRSPETLILAFEKIFRDISDKKINTRGLNKATDINDYFDTLPEGVRPQAGVEEPTIAFRDANVPSDPKRPRQKAAAKTAAPVPTKTAKPKPLRANLAPSKHTFSVPGTTKGQELLREASKLNLVDLPLACAYMLRAFLEHTIDMYMSANNLPFYERGNQLDLKVRADRVVNHLIQNEKSEAKHLKGVKLMLTGSSDPASIKSLNDYHHDRYQVPAVDVLRNAWDSAVPLFEAVYGLA